MSTLEIDARVHDYVTVQLTSYMFARSVALIATGYDGNPVQGSGSCTQICGRFFISTVAHIARYREDSPIFIATEKVSDMVLKVVTHGSRGHETPFSEEDVGWIEITKAAARVSGRTFMPLSELAPNLLDFDEMKLHLIGSPGSATEARPPIHGRPSVRIHAYPLFTEQISPPAGATFREGCDIYVDYPSEQFTVGGATRAAPPAQGMSGGGVWASPKFKAGALWSPQPRFVGIIRSSMDAKWIRGTRVGRWLRMIAEELPELAPEIIPVLGP